MAIDWAAIEKDYIPGKFGYKSLAKKYGIPNATIESHMNRLKHRKQLPINNSEADIKNCIINSLGTSLTIESILARHKISERVLDAYLDDIKDMGYDIVKEDNKILLNREAHAPVVFSKNWDGNKTIKFAVISDTHLNSNAQQLTHLNSFYDVAKAEGVDTIYHCGDLVDGDCVYPGHQFEVFNIGIDKQKDYAIVNYPKREGITTVLIGGNHDLKWFHKGGVDICKAIAFERPDLKYLGQYVADIEITPNCKLRLEHPMGKPAYAVSYKTQRKIDNMRGGLKPNILCEGHYHYSANFFRRNVHALCVPSFQGPTAFSTRLGLETDNGGFIITLTVDGEGNIVKFCPVFYPYYVIIDKDF